jgi:heparinase II/III-like protein
VPSKAMHVTAAMFKRPLKQDEMLPEFKALRRDPEAFAKGRVAKQVLKACRKAADQIEPIPVDSYTLRQRYDRIKDRWLYDQLYFGRRTGLSTTSLLALLTGEQRWLDLTHDAIWNLCNDHCWVPPEHMSNDPIDLFSAETAFQLAETAYTLSDRLDAAVAERIEAEVERRILAPFLEKEYGWADGHNNWAGVCAGAVGAAFLYLERNPARLARAINRVLAILARFLDHAFLADGGSSEGVGYWQYGLLNTVAFGELLRCRTRGQVDLLAHEKFKKIAHYPYAVQVAPGSYYHCSDCHGHAKFIPGFIARLAERTGSDELASFLNPKTAAVGLTRFVHTLRSMLWWDGTTHRRTKLTDHLLPDTAVTRLLAPSRKLALMAKAGHNAENHNHNDIGSFALYVDGEPVLCDPGCGHYDGDYFGPGRYDNPVCGSHGHSVPTIGGRCQKTGAEYGGAIEAFDPDDAVKQVDLEFAGAYGLRGLKRLDRSFRLKARGADAGSLTLEDTFTFSGKAAEIEEVFATWGAVSVKGATARVRAKTASLTLRIAEPEGATFCVDETPVRLARSAKPTTLRRITCKLPKGATSFALTAQLAAK